MVKRDETAWQGDRSAAPQRNRKISSPRCDRESIAANKEFLKNSEVWTPLANHQMGAGSRQIQ
ncbi:hypothetical protein [Nodosilinea sp. P-1105]|uniref:hypothetical protein n=1 Tax=Nodosilinea sp. P-1105 TaxID=2546229 RepID=UPI00146C9D81|nr:hypothetical protein [Nodosilinea sp. P-1105]